MNGHIQAQIMTLRNQAKTAFAQGDGTASLSALRQALALAQQDKSSLLYGAVCLDLVERHARTLSHLEIRHLLREAVRVFQSLADQGVEEARSPLATARLLQTRMSPPWLS